MNKNRNSINEQWILYLSTVFIVAFPVCFFFSRAGISICTMAIFILGFAYQILSKPNAAGSLKFNKYIMWLVVGYFGLNIVFSFTHFSWEDIYTSVKVLSPFLLFSYGIYQLMPLYNDKKKIFEISFWILIIINFSVLLQLIWLNLSDTVTAVTLADQSRNLENYTGHHHNVIGLISVVSIIFLFQKLLKYPKNAFLIIALILHIVFIHFCGLRFAIIGFYMVSVNYIVRSKTYLITKIAIFISIVTFFLLSVMIFPTFNARLRNTMGDFMNISMNKNPNYQSIHQRFIANELAAQIFYSNWLRGVGYSKLETVMIEKYDQDSRLLIPQNRIFVHNQLLFGMAALGIIYLIVWIVTMGGILVEGHRRDSFLSEITIVFICHQMIENTLHKQYTLALFVFILSVYIFIEKKTARNYPAVS